VDLIAWDGEWPCFVGVKTRSSRDLVPAEAAIDDDKQTMLRRMARAYLRGFPEPARSEIPVRFDVVSIYFEPAGLEIELQKGAFRWA
jgi:putative endonuclease